MSDRFVSASPARFEHGVWIIVAAFAILAAIYAWATPIFEASDELWHFGVIEHLLVTGDLPVQIPGEETTWEQEGSQPPLYYLLSSLLLSRLDLSDLETLREPNPHARAGVPGDYDNKNLVLHSSPHALPQGSALAVYVVRGFSVGLAIVSLLAVYTCARLTLPGNSNAALLALGLTAFNPMFLFISASVNNANLVIVLNCLLTWQMLLMLRDGFAAHRSAIIALLIALTSLAKLSGLVMIPTIAIAALIVAFKRRDVSGLMVLGVLVVGLWLVVAGWWYARNIVLYGELFGTQTMVAVAGPRMEPFSLRTLLAEFEGFRITYWGLFGAVNILTWKGFYVLMDVVTVAALVGLGSTVWRGRHDTERLTVWGLMGLTLLVGCIGIINWTAQTYASQGRLLFPFVAVISPLLAVGLTRLKLPVRPSIVVLGAIATLIPFGSIAPAYARPATVDVLPASAQPVYARFDEVVLIGYETTDTRYSPGDSVQVTLYWQVEEGSNRDLSLYLHAVNQNGDVVGKIDTYPGGGRLRTSTWQAGQIYVDHYRVPLERDASGQSNLRILVGWWHYPSQTYIMPAAEDGRTLDSVMLNAGGFSDGRAPQDTGHLLTVERVKYGGLVEIEGYALSVDNVLTLAWKSLGNWQQDYTVFVQVLDEAGQIVGQGDAPPTLPTRYWRRDEHYLTQHAIHYPETLQAGIYRIVVGWYSPVDFARLGNGYPDAAFELATFSVD